MTEPEPPRPTGSHRRARGANRLAVLVASLVGVAIAAGLVIYALHQRGEPARQSAPSSKSPSPSASNSISPSATGPSLTTSPPPSTSLSTSVPPSTPGSPTSTTASPPAQALPALDVLNDSRITGLAARASAQFTEAGWDVATTGNFQGTDVPSTTIFYPDGARAAAERLAAQFRIRRVLPATDGLSTSHLTVALARDWASRG